MQDLDIQRKGARCRWVRAASSNLEVFLVSEDRDPPSLAMGITKHCFQGVTRLSFDRRENPPSVEALQVTGSVLEGREKNERFEVPI